MLATLDNETYEDTTGLDLVLADGNAEFAPIACSNCRRSHRKCDRKLPHCSECVAKKKKCTFLIPKKRGPLASTQAPSKVVSNQKNHGHGYHPYMNTNPNTPTTPLLSGGNINLNISPDLLNNSSGEQEMIQRYMAAQTMDIYFEIVCLGFPLMERHKMELLLFYHHNTTSTKAPANEELALMYAIQAFCYQRIGQRQLAQQFFERSRATLSIVFDQVMHSFPVAACYCYLAYYLISDDDLDKAKFFLHNVNQYLDHKKQQMRLQKKSTMPEITVQQMVRETFLQQLVVICNILIQNSLNDFHGQLFNLGKLIKLFHTLTIYKTKESNDGLKSDPLPLMAYVDDDEDDNETLCKYMDSITLSEQATEHCRSLPSCNGGAPMTSPDDKTPTTNNPNGPISDCVRVERISVAFQRFFDSLSGKITEMQLDILKLTFLIIAQGVKIQLLIRSGAMLLPVSMQTADKISALTGTHWFAMCPPLVISAVVNAATVHLSAFESTTSAEERLRLINIMREDLRGLNVMKAKYNLVANRYADIVSKLEQIQRQFEEQQQIFMTFMSQMDTSKIGSADTNPSPSVSSPFYAFNFDMQQPQNTVAQEVPTNITKSEPTAPQNQNEDLAGPEDFDDFIDTLLNDSVLLTPTTTQPPTDLFM